MNEQNLMTVWTGADGWLLGDLPTHGHLVAPTWPRQAAVPLTPGEYRGAFGCVKSYRTSDAIAVVLTRDWQEFKELRAAADVSRPTAHKYLRSMVADGTAERQMRPVKGRRGVHTVIYYRRAK